MTKFVEQYLKLLIQQYYDKPKAVAEMTTLIENSEAVFNFLNAFRDEFDIDQAWGNRLDIIGKIVGINRIVPYGILKKYFGFSGIANTEGFGKAPFFNLVRDSDYTDTQLSDEQMRFFIKAKSIVNSVRAVMSNDEKTSLQDATQFLFSGNAYMLDNYNMSTTIYFNENIFIDDIVLLKAQGLLPKPQGVKLFLVQYYEGDTFGFSGDPTSKGFGEGKFAKLIVTSES